MLDWMNEECFKLVAALALGGCIGLEREISDKAAGLRTNILICLGATLFTIISDRFGNDPARIAAQIVSGIGFLGAGAIMHEGDRVTGLTTAATIWTVAAIGMSVGFGHYQTALWVTLAVIFVQLAFTQLDILIDDWRERHTFRIISKLDEESIEELHAIFREARLRVMRKKIMKRNNVFYSEWFTAGPRVAQEKVKKRLLESKAVLELTY